MLLVRWFFIGLLVAGLAQAQEAHDSGADAVSDAARMQAYRAQLLAAARQVSDGREAWLLASVLEASQAQVKPQAQDRAVIAALRARAAKARAYDPLLLRRMLSDSNQRAVAPEQADALFAQIEALDPGNAFNSLAVIHLAPNDFDDPIYDQRIQEMAAADHYRSDFMPVLRAIYAALARSQGLAEYPSEADSQAHASELNQTIVAAMGIAAATAMPAYAYLVNACKIDRFPARSEPCQRIAERMFNDADTLMDRLIALSLLQSTAPDAAARARAQALRREADWQLAKYQNLMFRTFGTAAMLDDNARYFGDLFRRGELTAMHHLLAANAIPLQPPADWKRVNKGSGVQIGDQRAFQP